METPRGLTVLWREAEMFCSSSRWFRATVAFPFSVFSNSIDRFSPVISHDLISNCIVKYTQKIRKAFSFLEKSWLNYLAKEHFIYAMLCCNPCLFLFIFTLCIADAFTHRGVDYTPGHNFAQAIKCSDIFGCNHMLCCLINIQIIFLIKDWRCFTMIFTTLCF